MSNKVSAWWQQPMLSRVKREIPYRAWISATGDPSSGVSACAWQLNSLEKPDVAAIVDAKISSGISESTEQRGYVAAAFGVVACLTKSNVTIHCSNEYVVDGLNGRARLWREEGWRDATNKQERRHKDLWESILNRLESQKVTVHAIHTTRRDSPVLEAVHQRAIEARDAGMDDF